METTFTWEIRVKNCPLLIKKCSHCDSDRFYCSDKFRMNAQKKNIDVWLIYRCVKCDNTCNMTLLLRTKHDLIDKKLMPSFSIVISFYHSFLRLRVVVSDCFDVTIHFFPFRSTPITIHFDLHQHFS